MRVYEVNKNDRMVLSSTSKGIQIKWKVGSAWLKADSFGYESISEALVSTLERYIKGIDYVDYSLCMIREKDEGGYKDYYGCVSEDFIPQGSELISMYKILYSSGINIPKKLNGIELVNYIVGGIARETNLKDYDIYNYLSNIVKLDSIILNEDRHLNNICFLKNYNGEYSFSPIFDNGLSLLSDLIDYDMSKSDVVCINSVKSKPFSSSFSKQLGYFSCYNELHIDYKKFISVLDNSFVEFKTLEFERAKRVLLYMLQKRKGLAWVDV